MTRLRAGVGGMSLALLLAASVGAQVTPFSDRVFNEQVLRRSGQPVIPLFEGYYPNPDGTYEICFGYFNLNTEEDVDIPLGPDNMIEPAEFDGMQPTHFDRVPAANYRRRFCVFTVNVPADFGEREVRWTLNTHGEAITTPGKVLLPYFLDEPNSGGRGIIAPVLRFEEDGPEFKGRTGFTGERLTVAVGDPLTLSVWVDHPDDRSWVAWTLHQGAGRVTFAESEMWVPKAEGVSTTTARFGEPGEYLIRVQAIDSPTSSFEFHCCWTNGYIPVTVVQ
ncbi:MAG: hypothetical protein IH921_02125 [Gemmatimonadetes bacterium]|nr:hypothetical protein [Gemmatimonadota bacterium]MCH7934773.1 hypothetical protein [Gemmatimonadota bacterium]